MNIPYRTRRKIQTVGTILLALLLIGLVAWFCWVVWLERYIVYTDDGATLDLTMSANEVIGEVAVPPVANADVPIYYNEGDNAIELGNQLKKLNGYYIDAEMLQSDISSIWNEIGKLASGTPILIDMKGGYGSFYYSSNLNDAIHSQSVSVTAVDELITELQRKGFYTIARVSAFRDYNYGLNHVTSGLYMLSRAGLWPDEGGCYWLDPTNATTLTWITSIVLELKGIGFNEVLLTDFRFPNSDQYIFDGDKDAALQDAATKLMANCASSDFTLSFCVDNAAFPLPEGRCRMYLTGVDAANVGAKASQISFEDPEVRLVFIAETNDTRFDSYGVLRSIKVSDVLEAQKADKATGLQ